MSAEAERWEREKARPKASGDDALLVQAGDDLLAALEARDREHDAAIGRMVGEIEARDRRIADLEAGVQEALSIPLQLRTHAILRDLLAGRTAGGEYPHLDGDVIVLGPGIFASADGSVINWKGENYTPQPDPGDVVEIARCPEHGLHGDRHECFVCGGPAERVRMVPLERRAAGG